VAKRWHHFENRVRNAGPAVRTTLEQQEWLDRPSYRLEHALTILFAAMGRYRDRVSNALHGTWLGHPLHPALTSVPTGAMATTVAMDRPVCCRDVPLDFTTLRGLRWAWDWLEASARPLPV
jgi:hypothetical protein